MGKHQNNSSLWWRYYELSSSPFWLVAFCLFGSICHRYDCSRRRSGCQHVDELLVINRDRGCRRSDSHRSDWSLAINRDRRYRLRWFIQLNTRIATRFSRVFWVFFAYTKLARPNWDAISWEDGHSVDTNSLRHLPRQSSKNCDMQLANSDSQF